MRSIAGITFLLLGVAALSCRLEGVSLPDGGPPPNQWVRTVDGWERTDSWHVAAVPPATLHPLVVAAGQGLVSLLGLVAFSREARRAAPRP